MTQIRAFLQLPNSKNKHRLADNHGNADDICDGEA